MKRFPLALRITVTVSALIALVLGLAVGIVGWRLGASVGALVRTENIQIAEARAAELGKLLDKLAWQLEIMALNEQLRTGDRAAVEKVIRSYEGTVSPEVVGTFFAWPNGDYFTSFGAVGNLGDRDYCRAIFQEGANRAVSGALISKTLNVPIVVVAKAVKGPDGSSTKLASSSPTRSRKPS